MKSARLIAFEILYNVFQNNAYSNIALDSALKNTEKDKAFISALVYGVIERKITLDYFINKYVASKPKPKIMTVLRLGAYQLLFMDKVPVSAAVNESVKLTYDIKQSYYSSLVNAVLHKIDCDREIPDDLSVKYSVPENLINMWIKQYGREETEAFLPTVNERPPVFAIPNSMYCDADELCYELMSENVDCDVCNDVVVINSSFDLNKSNAYHNGLFYIEDMSSYECALSLDAKPGDTVLDMCSAPGGKAFTIAQSMKNSGRLLAFDIHQSRVNLMKAGVERLGLSVIECDLNDACIFNEKIPVADKILCDVPCSGFGIIRRKPEIRYKELDSVKEMPITQLNILETSSKYLKTHGRIVYSTCTLNKKENEKVVEAFLDNNKNFRLDFDKTVFPSLNGGDGFYHASLIKEYD